jgi:hypothetical protein
MTEWVNPKYRAAVDAIRSQPKLSPPGGRRLRIRTAVVIAPDGRTYVARPAGGKPAAEQ